MYIISVDCEWGDWKTSECSEECGGGTLIKTRYHKLNAAHGGAECSGVATITEECNTHNCPGKNPFFPFDSQNYSLKNIRPSTKSI